MSYMSLYMLNRYRQRKQEALEFLGGKCIRCLSEEFLEFDHKDRATKGFTIAKLWSVNKLRFWEEVSKCQLLCNTCHQAKTLEELGRISAKTSHGTLSSYKYCKCDICRKAKSDWMREYKKRRSASLTVKARSF